MKILHVAETVQGGVASVLDELAADQSARLGAGHVYALVPAGHDTHLPRMEKAQVSGFWRPERNVGSLLRLALAFVHVGLLVRPDIIHLHSTFAGAVCRPLLPLLWLAGLKPQVVYCPHGWAFGPQHGKWRNMAYALVERLLLPLSERVLLVADYEREQAEARGLTPGKLAVVHNGVPGPEAPAPAPVPVTGPLKLLFVGRFDSQKGYDILHGAMEILTRKRPDIALTLVGAPVRDGARLPELPNVRETGWIPRGEVVAHYRDADALVMPSRWEGLPMTALEALSHGLPVIASREASLPEIVTDGVNGVLVPENTPETWAEVLRLVSRRQLAGLRKAARADWEARFTADRMTADTFALYETLLKKA